MTHLTVFLTYKLQLTTQIIGVGCKTFCTSWVEIAKELGVSTDMSI